MPLIRRLPKRGFNNAAFPQELRDHQSRRLEFLRGRQVINEEMLRESKMIRGNVVGLKILGDGELKHALTIEAHKVSASARAEDRKAGGTVTLAREQSVPTVRRFAERRRNLSRRLRQRRSPAAKENSGEENRCEEKAFAKS